MDFITDLPESQGYNSILTIVDQGLSKGIILTPCNKTADSLQTVKMILDNVIRRYRIPKTVISDRGPQFASRTMKEVAKILGIEWRLSTAYHPQTNGESEQVNQEVENYLRFYCSRKPQEWSNYLPLAEFAHNVKEHSTTQKTPFSLILGYTPETLPTIEGTNKNPKLDKRLSQLDSNRREAIAAHALAAAKMAKWNPETKIQFEIGEKVWLEATNLKTTLPKKISPRRFRPFVISERIGERAY